MRSKLNPKVLPPAKWQTDIRKILDKVKKLKIRKESWIGGDFMNKVIVAIAVIILGVVAGWYVMGGKGNIPKFPTGNIKILTTPAAQPTAEATGLYQYREQNITGMPQPTGKAVTKGGVDVPTTSATYNPTGNTVRSKISVTYGDNGFAPATLTVKAGTTVVFTNQSGKGMWMVSGGFSNSPQLPDFNEGKSISRGGTYEYTFSKVGTWKYLNKMNLNDTGVVIVTR